ncbi:hypothetical protein BS329_34985 [Amycolatopsis coloradensis]|uniref:Uncharacterized protein n=1 Tax=Amycolatopsis coloradensis TaxID=76021 RepID=A0A1R0KGZ7_9PSEU|nr:hypothetical protein BS329_34985 [Amycolatopsis coloradensis]
MHTAAKKALDSRESKQMVHQLAWMNDYCQPGILSATVVTLSEVDDSGILGWGKQCQIQCRLMR